MPPEQHGIVNLAANTRERHGWCNRSSSKSYIYTSIYILPHILLHLLSTYVCGYVAKYYFLPERGRAGVCVCCFIADWRAFSCLGQAVFLSALSSPCHRSGCLVYLALPSPCARCRHNPAPKQQYFYFCVRACFDFVSSSFFAGGGRRLRRGGEKVVPGV